MVHHASPLCEPRFTQWTLTEFNSLKKGREKDDFQEFAELLVTCFQLNKK